MTTNLMTHFSISVTDQILQLEIDIIDLEEVFNAALDVVIEKVKNENLKGVLIVSENISEEEHHFESINRRLLSNIKFQQSRKLFRVAIVYYKDCLVKRIPDLRTNKGNTIIELKNFSDEYQAINWLQQS